MHILPFLTILCVGLFYVFSTKVFSLKIYSQCCCYNYLMLLMLMVLLIYLDSLFMVC